MNRHIFIHTTLPAVLIGLVLFGVGLVGAWSVTRLQINTSNILFDNVNCLQAAQEMEIRLRQVRFHSFLATLDPSPERLQVVRDDHAQFEKALEDARRACTLDGEKELVESVEDGYRRYHERLSAPGTAPPAARGIDAHLRWADTHPVGPLMGPCLELLRVNKEAMYRTALESDQVSRRVGTAMLLLGVAGPVGGLLCGYGLARGLSRSIARLQVRVRAVEAEMDHEAGAVDLAAAGDLRDLDRQLGRVVERVRDVTRQLHGQQAEMLRAEQLASVGRLAASVAHEVRNPLTAIKLLVGSALRGPEGAGLTAEDLRVIHGEIGRMEQTVQNLLDFARPSPPRRQPCDLRDAVGQALDLVQVRARQQGVAVRVTRPDAPVVVAADPGQLGSVLVNLFLNALDAMPEGGKMQVELSCPDAGRVRLHVRDSGQGLVPEIVPRLFSPFASTKPGGTGLGLSICRQILDQHGGTIAATNLPDGGACFTLTLPAGTAEVMRADPSGG